MNIKKIKFNKKGFVILIALVVSSLLLSIGIFIQNVAYKELLLSNSNKNTQIAFSAADTAIECALYQEFRKYPFRANSGEVRETAEGAGDGYPIVIFCNGTKNIELIDDTEADGDSATTIYEGSLMDSELPADKECKEVEECKNSPYVKIKVTIRKKGTANEEFEIQAWAHNMYKNSSSSVERSLKVKL